MWCVYNSRAKVRGSSILAGKVWERVWEKLEAVGSVDLHTKGCCIRVPLPEIEVNIIWLPGKDTTIATGRRHWSHGVGSPTGVGWYGGTGVFAHPVGDSHDISISTIQGVCSR